MRPNNFIPPWRQGCLEKWSIIGMNHYHVAGEKFIFVCMGRKSDDGAGFYIQQEGRDDVYLWNRLLASAEEVERKK